MSEEILIRHCAPTLASIKTGRLFTSRFESEEAMRGSLRELNRRIRSKGLNAIPLRCREGIGLIYLYRPQRLEKDLQQQDAAKLLADFGYQAGCQRHSCATWPCGSAKRRDSLMRSACSSATRRRTSTASSARPARRSIPARGRCMAMWRRRSVSSRGTAAAPAI